MIGYAEIQEAAAWVQRRTGAKPKVGVVLGSGLGAFSQRLQERVALPYRDIPHFPSSSVVGHAGELVLGHIGGVGCAVMSGRVHYYEGYDMRAVTFPMRVLAALGIKHVVLTNAAGGINAAFAAGDFMVINDHLNLTGQNPLRGPNDDRLGPRFSDMSATYSRAGRRLLQQVGVEVGAVMHEGVYAGVTGPSYETPAEIRMFRTLGADAVGMSTVAEVIVAAHAGLDVMALSVITNLAAGISPKALSHEEVKEVGERVQNVLAELLSKVITRLA